MTAPSADRLAGIYALVDARLEAAAPSGATAAAAPVEGGYLGSGKEAAGSGNRCGSCFACCTSLGASFHHVLEVEHAVLAERYGSTASQRFREFTARQRTAQGELLHAQCPFYDREVAGCGIYPDRPYACRSFGRYRLEGTRAPEGCVYESTAEVVPSASYFTRMPQATELRDLDRAWGAQQVVPLVHSGAATHGAEPQHEVASKGASEASPQAPRAVPPSPAGATLPDPVDLIAQARHNADPDNPLDQAVLAHLEGRLDEAAQAFEVAVARFPHDGYAHFYRGQLLDQLGRHREASRSYLEAVALIPEHPRFWLHLAFAQLEAGDAAAARHAFHEVTRLQPAEGLAHGFLGSLLWQGGDALQAFPHLERALSLQPDNPWFSLRLGEVCSVLPEQQHRLATVLATALGTPKTQAAAAALLARQGQGGGGTEPSPP